MMAFRLVRFAADQVALTIDLADSRRPSSLSGPLVPEPLLWRRTDRAIRIAIRPQTGQDRRTASGDLPMTSAKACREPAMSIGHARDR